MVSQQASGTGNTGGQLIEQVYVGHPHQASIAQSSQWNAGPAVAGALPDEFRPLVDPSLCPRGLKTLPKQPSAINYSTNPFQGPGSNAIGVQRGGSPVYPLTELDPFASVKFPEFSVPGFAFGPGLMTSRPLSISPPSSTNSRTSSVGEELLSPIYTEFASQPDNFTGWASCQSRGPSPLSNSVQFNLRSHVCLWGNNGPCENGAFSTRDELNWHVKSQHLLICPILGCTESGFDSKEVVECHIRWAHKDVGETGKCQSSNLLGSMPMSRSNSLEKPKRTQDQPLLKRDAPEERMLKLEMSICVSKKRCHEKLRNVVEKKLKMTNANSSPGSAGSPGTITSRTSKMLESASFPMIWEHGVLPFLIEFIPKWCGPGHVISVTRGKKQDTRRICLMTRKPISKARKVLIAAHVQDLLPKHRRRLVSFVFSVGEIERLTWARGLSKEIPDEVCTPRNPFCYISPCMGDSIGCVLDDGDDVTATLGPCVTIGATSYFLASFHPFVEANQTGKIVYVEHPSPSDRDRCLEERHDALKSLDLNFQMGKLTATSGYDLKTTRLTHESYWEDMEKEPPLIVTDWTLISANTKQAANILRKFPNSTTPRREAPVTKVSSIVPVTEVISTGRTSGHQRGQVCEIPAYLDARANGTGKPTREWFIEEPDSNDNENEWIRGGIGVPGDSGAAIIDCETNALIGTVFGRNRYFGAGPRRTYFTPIFDIFDDIQERCGEPTRPQLPQYRDEADRWPVYPVCRQCFDLREYHDSRRSSRESLLSMIPGSGAGGEHDHDLTSVSELATPKTVGDHGNWTRHSGIEEIGSSFQSMDNVVSPAPLNAFFNSAASPWFGDVRSPYALALNDDDLHDPNCPGGIDTVVGLGKRPCGPAPLVRTRSQSGKKRRIM